jgi:hypothetical protein
MSVFAPEAVSFDLGPQLQHGGGEIYKTLARAFRLIPGSDWNDENGGRLVAGYVGQLVTVR